VTEKPTVDIVAEKLLSVLRAATPFTGSDEESPHFMMLRFTAERHSLEVAATDGKCLAMLNVPIEGAEPVVFCLLTTHVPMLVKVLQRLDAEQRSELVVTITVGRTKLRFAVGETEVWVPKAEQQTEFPFVEKAIPDRPRQGQRAAALFAVGTELFSKVMRAGSYVAHSLELSVPAGPEAPLRFDVVEASLGITGLFVVMPMKLQDSADRDAKDAARRAKKLAGDARQTSITDDAE
jgi:hypothetical protein